MAFRVNIQFQMTRHITAKSGYIIRAAQMPGIKKPASGARALT